MKNQMTPQTTNENPSEAPTTNAGCASGACPLMTRRGKWLWVALIAVLVFLQWPMIKGLYYRATGGTVLSKVTWQADFDAALAKSVETGKPLLVDFTAGWCPPCNVMKHEVWTDDRVAAKANGFFIPVKIDIDASEGAPIAQRYGVQTIPTILLLDSRGQVSKTGSFMDADAMLTFLSHPE